MTDKKILQDRKCPMDATVHWCLIFERRLSRLVIDDETPCTLNGTVVWQNLDSYLEGSLSPNRAGWTTDENIEETGPGGGITCTLGELRKGKINARLALEFTPENATGDIRRNLSWSDIADIPLRVLLKTLQKKVLSNKMKDTSVVSLARFNRKNGYIGQRSLKYTAALAAARGVPLGAIPRDQVYKYLVREIVDKKEYVRHGSKARIVLYNGAGEIVTRRTFHSHLIPSDPC